VKYRKTISRATSVAQQSPWQSNQPPTISDTAQAPYCRKRNTYGNKGFFLKQIQLVSIIIHDKVEVL
jgi:hypothetical protein